MIGPSPVRSASAAIIAGTLCALVPAAAASTPDPSGPVVLSARLQELNSSAASGTVEGVLAGDQLTLEFSTQELLSNARHAQHLYLGGENMCPDPAVPGSGAEGSITTTDGQDSYGELVVSLTTTGDTTPESAYDFRRYPLGSTPYQRTVTVPPEVAAAILENKVVIAQLGSDTNANGGYDGEARSEVIQELPEEATNPTTCAILTVGPTPLPPRTGATQISQVPVGGVATGGGSTAPNSSGGTLTLMSLGGVLAAMVGGGLLLKDRRTR